MTRMYQRLLYSLMSGLVSVVSLECSVLVWTSYREDLCVIDSYEPSLSESDLRRSAPVRRGCLSESAILVCPVKLVLMIEVWQDLKQKLDDEKKQQS